MTTFVFKLIAIIAMLIDHVGAYLQLSGSTLVDYQILEYMRAIGRMALPIFMYFLVVGFDKTSNRNKYIGRLHLFAIISQIPFTLAFLPGNHYEIVKQNNFLYNTSALIYIIPMILGYWFLICDRKVDSSLVLVALAWLLIPVTLQVNGYFLLAGIELNIFYELGAALILMAYVNKFVQYFRKDFLIQFVLIIAFYVTFSYITSLANYQTSAILLGLMLYMVGDFNLGKALIIAYFGYIQYSWSMLNVFFVLLTAVLVLLYNGKKGRSMKYFFYAFYPIHLLILALLNIYNIQ